MKPPKLGAVKIVSGYGAYTRQPYVEIRLPEREPLRLDIDEARIVGQMILEACEAAEGDAFLVEWFTEQIGVELPQAATMLHEFRQWRDARRKKQKTRTA